MRRTLALALAAGLLACSTKYTSVTGHIRLGKTPEENYQRGVEEMNAKHYPEAMRFFELIKAKYPFSAVSVACDLRLADIKFMQERWVEAAAAFEAFAKEHPSSTDVEYATYKAGVAHYKASPGDAFLLPPAQEKDLTETDKAVTQLRSFVAAYPKSKYIADAKATLARAELLAAKREMYVGDFYYKREYWAGAASRYKGLADGYPATPLAEPALFKLAESYVKLKERYQARQALQRLIIQHPGSRQRRAAEKLLESLR
jgi:outer membrane protein assembly factor BamD